MLEVEVKYRRDDFEELERRIVACGGRVVVARTEADHYWNAPDRDYARTDEALRLRRIGDRNLLTYKGPRRDLTTKTRRELETECREGASAGDDLLTLFELLGYRVVAVVRKQRRILEWTHGRFAVQICLDDVETVGRYAELEIVAEEADGDAARAEISAVADELGLSNPETRSYLELQLGTTVPPGGAR